MTTVLFTLMSQQPLNSDKQRVKVTFAGASAATALRPITYSRTEVDGNSFNTPPAALVTALPRIRGETIPYDRYTTFCSEWFLDGALVFYAEVPRRDTSTPRQLFALKVAFNVANGIASFGGSFMQCFVDEALFYKSHLAHLQGTAVPKHYGVWVGRTAWDTTVACSIMEWGGRPLDEQIIDPNHVKLPERSAKIMEALKAIHDAGFEHNDLRDDPFRHILYDTSREKASIIDFSTAGRHKCGLSMEMKPYRTQPCTAVFGCDELWDVANHVLYFGDEPCDGPNADPEVVEAHVRAYNEDIKEREARSKRGSGRK